MAAQPPATRLLAVARASLTLAVAAGLVRVFADGPWLAAVLAAAALPGTILALGAARRWAEWARWTAVGAAAALVTIWTAFPASTERGLPTARSLEALRAGLAAAPAVLRRAEVPVEPAGDALALALVALLVAATATEWAARRLHATLGAASPSLVLFVSITALGDGASGATTAVYASALAAYLVALHHSELTTRRTWFHAPGTRRPRRLGGGAVAAAAAVTVAVVAGPFLPGARSEAWFDYRALGEGSGDASITSTTPIVGVRAKLLEDPEREVLRVTTDVIEVGATPAASEAAYWRTIALDDYQDEVWTVGARGRTLDRLPRPPASTTGYVLRQRFRLVDADPIWVPAAYHPIAPIEGLDDVRVLPDTATLYRQDRTPMRDLAYTVDSRIAVPDRSAWARSRHIDPADFPDLLALPDDFPRSIRRLARDVVDGAQASTPYEQAVALERFFTGGSFTYTLLVDDDDGRLHDLDTLEDFLFEVRAGYCEQFATAYATMARVLGIPARVAVGYAPGERAADGTFVVRNKDAHAWPELYFDDIGWMPFEPTPIRFEPTGARGAGRPTGTPGPAAGPSSTLAPGAPGSTAPPPSIALTDPEAGIDLTAPPSREPAAEPVREVLGAASLIAVSVAVLTIGVAAVLWLGAGRRTWRRRRAPTARARVVGAWAEALDRLAEAGVTPRPAATPLEFALRHAPAHGIGSAGPPLMELARLQTRAVYAPHEPDAGDAALAWQHVRAIAAGVRCRAPRSRRWWRRLRPERPAAGDRGHPARRPPNFSA
jgi:transglutaminase-like putative cysteine protease